MTHVKPRQSVRDALFHVHLVAGRAGERQLLGREVIGKSCNRGREVGNFRGELLDGADDDGDELGVGEAEGVVGVVADAHGLRQDGLHFLRDEAEVRALLGVRFPDVGDGTQLHNLVEAVGRARDVVLEPHVGCLDGAVRGIDGIPEVRRVAEREDSAGARRDAAVDGQCCRRRRRPDADVAVLVDDEGGGGGDAGRS